MQTGVKFAPRPLYRTPNNTRKQNKVMVDDLPFPHPRTPYNAKWQKVFRPTLLSWASTFSDPYATDTLLEEPILLEMWDIIYPEIDLDKEDRMDTGVKLIYLVCVLLSPRSWATVPFQAGNILHDWRTTIGTGALNVVKNHFLFPANQFNKERITKFVQWGLDPKKFNFIYGDPNAETVRLILMFTNNTDIGLQNQKQGFRSDLVLNVYAIHLKKVVGAAATYGDQYGALALCTAAVSVVLFMLLDHTKRFPFYQTERALSFWASGEDMSMKTDENGKRKLAALFGEMEWGSRARGWAQSTSRLDFEQWRAIDAEATARVKKLPQDEAAGEDIPLGVDPRAMLEL